MAVGHPPQLNSVDVNRLGIGCQEDMGEATFGGCCGQGVKIIFEFKSRVCSRNKNIYPARRNCWIIGGNGLNTSNIFPVCQAQCDGILIAQAYNPELDNPINRDFVADYTAENKKAPPQFTAQAFTGIQVFVEALKRVDDKNKLSTLSLEQIRQQLNQEILAGKYVTVLGDIAFTPEGEIIQDKFSVAQIKMDADGKNGKFTFVEN
jgi:branched-chain amino acid transport system substrate-binding protein